MSDYLTRDKAQHIRACPASPTTACMKISLPARIERTKDITPATKVDFLVQNERATLQPEPPDPAIEGELA
ncbi:hypothetical protein KCU99_g295, partial [Aureobasidium melanogenum]